MKKFTITLAIAASVLSSAAFANGSGAVTSIDFSTLTLGQLDALTGILSGLPRN